LNILKTEPQLINFIYGPINSGKTTLITNLIENLPDDYVIFYVNLRRKSIIRYEDFIRVLFAIEEGGLLKKIKNIFTKVLKHVTSTVEKAAYKFTGIPVDKGLLETFFKEKSNEDVFNYLAEYFKNISKHKMPVLVIDELQVIGDLEIDGKLIYKLFNFFIRLTKELHVCHVFALSSDSLFIEKVYNEVMLQDRCKYIHVDDFDEETTKKFLEKYNISKEDEELVWNNFGGKPIFLSDSVNTKFTGKNINEAIQKTLKNRKGQIEEIIYTLKDKNEEMFKGCTDVLEKFRNSDNFDYLNVTKYIRFLVEKNIIFVNCAEKNIKAQSKINLIAIREILKEIGE